LTQVNSRPGAGGSNRAMKPWELALLAALAGTAAAQPPARELIYGAELMTPEERAQYRKSIADAKEDEARTRVRAQHRERVRERARQKGVGLREPHGVLHAAPK
jgi:hypothetical protein